ncbi:MAG: hypothetical protein EON58_16290 [Alphaproteobacteria bacterium]|nr:MAG: hypothetical protein EON58_16290 [Alphaproteobacteria bacterium]
MKQSAPDLTRLAVLDGVSVGDIEPTASTVIFHLCTENGESFKLDLHMMLRALLLCCDYGALPSLPLDWIVQAAGIHGEAFQKNA